MVTKTIPSKPKPNTKEADFSNEDTTLTPEQEKAAREKAKSLTKKLADDKGKSVSYTHLTLPTNREV